MVNILVAHDTFQKSSCHPGYLRLLSMVLGRAKRRPVDHQASDPISVVVPAVSNEPWIT